LGLFSYCREDAMAKTDAGSGRTGSLFDSWVGRVAAVAGLVGTLAGGMTWWISRERDRAQQRAQLVLGATQAAHGDYSAALESYGDRLKSDPADRTALDGQLNAAELWAENFSVMVPEGGQPADAAGPELDRIFAVLEAGLARTAGSRKADVEAHLGWTHWLNQHIAEREFGDAAESGFHAALALDPQNVYAHAMLGNWLLQTGGDFSEAVQHFQTAVATGRARPFVRELEIDGLLSRENAASGTELFRVANQMRLANEPLDADSRRQILSLCCNPMFSNHAELAASLTAVGPDDAWNTYLWLDHGSGQELDAKTQAWMQRFIQANLLEIRGQREQSLQQFRQLQAELAQQPGSLKDAVDAAVVRLQHAS
jgi:tetratricopeptide (TPR) repeat protein